jgi:hypothetical protein
MVSFTTALIAAGIILIPGTPLLSIALNANVLAAGPTPSRSTWPAPRS